jgi:hypothetical protein
VNAPVSYPHHPDYRRDWETAVAIRQQQASIDALNAARAAFVAAVAPLSFSLGEPCEHYDVADMLDLIRDFAPTQTDVEMAQRAEELAEQV